MKLSDALRLGEFALPPVRDDAWFKFDKQALCGGCAVGRLLYAVGYQPCSEWEDTDRMEAFMSQQWPWILGAGSSCPPGTFAARSFNFSLARHSLLYRISDLYEQDGWTMAQIADWVETLEPQEPPAPVPVAGEEMVGVEG